MAFPSLDGTGVPVDNETGAINTLANASHSSPAEESVPGHSADPIPFIKVTEPPCQWILYSDINNSGYVSFCLLVMFYFLLVFVVFFAVCLFWF